MCSLSLTCSYVERLSVAWKALLTSDCGYRKRAGSRAGDGCGGGDGGLAVEAVTVVAVLQVFMICSVYGFGVMGHCQVYHGLL